MKALVLFVLVATGVSPLAGQILPARDDTRHSMLREAMLGLLPAQAVVPDTEARHRCLLLPVDPPNDRLQGPRGDSLLAAKCEVVSYQPLGSAPGGPWFSAQYRWLSLFTAEDSAGKTAARDSITEGEAVLFASPRSGLVRAVWHERFESDDYAIYRSITPEAASPTGKSTLLSVMSCVNGTSGCSQEFILRHPDGQWAPVWQVWLDRLPKSLAGRIQHGVRIDVRTLEGKAGLYGAGDPNCCPSQELRVQLGLQGDSLVLRQRTVLPAPRS